jgi:hypothetical protein
MSRFLELYISFSTCNNIILPENHPGWIEGKPRRVVDSCRAAPTLNNHISLNGVGS